MSETPDVEVKEAATSNLSEQERELAQLALSEFQRESYTNCLTHLNKLEALRPKDLKVTHNKLIAEYFKGDLKKTELTRKSLNAICGQSSNLETTETVEDAEKCVMRYNQAIILYHTKQYNQALQIMNKLLSYIEPMEENLSHKVCLLLIELYILINQPKAALSLVNYFDNQFISVDVSKTTNVEKDGSIKLLKVVNDAVTEAFKVKLSKCRARIYLMLQQLQKSNWENLAFLESTQDISSILLKANFEYLKGNNKKAIDLLNSLKQQSFDFKTGGESLPVLYYNNVACVHFAMGKPNLACFYLEKALTENKKAMESIQSKDSDPLSSQPLFTLGGNKYFELMYSLGVSLLYAGKPAKAFDCFTESAQRFHNNPRLWLRLAECCIYAHKSSNEIDFNVIKRRKDLVEKVIGTGPYRKIILTSSLSKDSVKYNAEGLSYAIPQTTLEFAMLCLKNALFLLPSNKELNSPVTPVSGLPQPSTLTLEGGYILGGKTPSVVNFQATAFEAFNLKMSVLTACAYVSLCLGDYVVALEHATALLNLNKLPEAHRLLGHLYAAESLIYLNRIDEAIEYLKIDKLQDLNTNLSILDFNNALSLPGSAKRSREKTKDPPKLFKPWFPTSPLTGKAILEYNLAVAYAIRGEFDKSGETLKQVWVSKSSECDIPIHVIMLALYIELQLGHPDVARTLIKQHCPQH